MPNIEQDEYVPLPRDSFKLIDLLDELFPHRCIGQGQTPEEAHRYAGMRDVVDQLIQMRAEDEEHMRSQDEDEEGRESYSILKQDGVTR